MQFNGAKVYVSVNARFAEDGSILPLSLTWEDGTEYEIDRVTDIRRAAAMKAGGRGDRYTIIVRGRESFLFFERIPYITGNIIGRWFVQRR